MSRRWITPSWFAVLLLVAGVSAFSYLGAWQLKRAADKASLIASYAGNADRESISLADARRSTAADQFPKIRTMGRIDPQHAYILDDQIRDGRQGVMVYAVVLPEEGGTALLVNRGFLARLPGGALPVLPPLESGVQTWSGIYAPPPGIGLRLGGNALLQQTTWPKLTIHIDLEEIAADFGKPLDKRVLLLEPDPASGFVREWTPQILPPERHQGYAFQWFAFALAAIVIFIVLHWRREKSGSK